MEKKKWRRKTGRERQPRGTSDGCTRAGTHQEINTDRGPPHTTLERVRHGAARWTQQARTADTRSNNQVDGLAGIAYWDVCTQSGVRMRDSTKQKKRKRNK